jgi:hypothetical protein
MKQLLVFIFILLNAGVVLAQDSAAVANDITVLYRKESSGGVTIHSNGLGVIFRHGTHVTIRKKRMFEAEFVSLRHPKQVKRTNDYLTGEARPFFYGKLNYVYIPRVGLGRQQVIFGKAQTSGVEVRANLFGGVDLGLTKPVYLKVLETDPYNEIYKIAVVKRYDPEDPGQRSPEDFLGPASWFNGFGEMKFYPGLYGKFSFSFEYSTMHQKVAILETGFVVDAFLKKVPIMAYIEPEQYYFNFYITLLWGAKKN